MNKPIKIILGLIVAAGLFYGGVSYGQSVASATNGGRTGSTSFTGTGSFSGRTGGGATVGTVVSSDATSITIALKSGSVVAFYSTSTPITKITSGSVGDITAGANITVLGTTNSDGSVTANSIQIR